MRLAFGSRTDIGRTRKRNEDSMLVREPLFVVADGMGGHRGGNVASAMTVEVLGVAPVATGGTAAVVDAIRTANRAVLERGDAEPELRGMGTTVTALFVDVDADMGHVAHVGDSRAYLLRRGALQQLTEDHTVVQELVRQGRLTPQDAERHPQRSIITRALGVDDEVDVDELTLALHDGDRFILCSDGLTLMLSEDGIALVLGTTPDPQDAADRLVSLANEAGGEDNITVIVVDVLADPPDAGRRPDAASLRGRRRSTRDGIDGADRARRPGERPRVGGAPGPATTASPPARAGGRRPPDRLAGRRSDRRVPGRAGVPQRAVVRGRLRRSRRGLPGIPANVLGVHLADVARLTPLSATEAARLAGWETLRDGITAESRSDADQIVERIRGISAGRRRPRACRGRPPDADGHHPPGPQRPGSRALAPGALPDRARGAPRGRRVRAGDGGPDRQDPLRTSGCSSASSPSRTWSRTSSRSGSRPAPTPRSCPRQRPWRAWGTR